jgi:hypothetical protein
MFFKRKRAPGSLGHLDHPSPHWKDCNVLKVHGGVEIHVFWKQVDAGSGPSCSVFVLGHELMKFDCFGEPYGHFHIALSARAGSTCNILRFDVATVEQQIDRAVFELANNLVYYCERCVHPAVRAFSMDQSAIASAAPDIKIALFEALASYKRATS